MRSLPYWIVGGITALAGFLRLFHVARESIWFDESVSIWLARMDLRSMWNIVATSEPNMSLYYLLLHAWLSLGESEFVVRSLSAVVGIVTIPIVFLLCRRLFNTRAALIASLLFAANTFHIRYSQEARSYTLLVLFVTLSSLYFVRAIERKSRLDWVWYVVTATLASYSHFFAWLVLGAQWLSLLALPRRDVPWRRVAVSIAAIALMSAPLMAAILLGKIDHLSWIPRSDFSKLYELFVDFTGLSNKGVPLFALVCLVGAYFAIRGRKWNTSGFARWHVVLLVIWLFLPVLLTFGASAWRPIFVERFLIISLPPFVMLTSAAIALIPSRFAVAAVALIYLASEARAIDMSEKKLTKQDWRGATGYILSQEQPADGIFFYVPGIKPAFDYYSRLDGHSWDAGSILYAAPDASGHMDVFSTSLPPNLHKQFPRVWLVQALLYSPQLVQKGQTLRDNFGGEYRAVAERDFNFGLEVILYSSEKVDTAATASIAPVGDLKEAEKKKAHSAPKRE